MEFFKNIKNSIYGPEYYSELLSKPISYSLKYYALFILLVSLIIAIVSAFIFIPNIKTLLDGAELKLISNYPAKLEVAVKNGQAQTNVQQPYFVKMPQSLKNFQSDENNSQPENFIVLDTANKFDLEKFTSYKTLAVLNKDTVAYIDSSKNNGITIQSLKNTPDFTLNKDKVVSWVGKIKPFVKFIYPIAIIFVFLISLFVLAWHLVYMFFGALFVWLAFKIKKIKISYIKSYQLGMHLMTPVIILTLILALAKFDFPFLFTILLTLSAVTNIKNYEKKYV